MSADGKIRLTIDGREIAVAPGTTLLEAARELGISIPTLCHVPGLEPSSSCFLCAVQVQGMRTLSPSCALPAAEGMVVETATEDVLDARRTALELLLSDHAGDCVAPCSVRCPAGLDIPGYVFEIASGEIARSMEVISGSLFLPGSLGRICPRLCEESCRRCDHDEALSIAGLHRFAADENAGQPEPWRPRRGEASGKSVAIVGAGPAGLTAAFYLLQQGHACTLFDAHEEPGGMLRYGIPAYRLPRQALDQEIATLRDLGAEFRMDERWGPDFELADLRARHDAVFLAIGAQLSQGLRCEGEELATSGIDFLAACSREEWPDLGREAVVVGGGNTAMDAARSALRLGARVRVIYRRTRAEMPCLLEEVEGALEEGVEIDFLVAPVRLALRDDSGGDSPRLVLTCRRMELGEPDASGRRRPIAIEGSDFELACDSVIAAVGQSVDLSRVRQEGLATTSWGIEASGETGETTLAGVFAGGDAVLGADLAVRAVAAGRIAAISIDQYLRGLPVRGPERFTDIALRRIEDEELAVLLREIERAPRTPSRQLDLEERRTTFHEIEAGFDAGRADRESRRCLSCGCRKALGCKLRVLATDLGVEPYRYIGQRRSFEQDDSHPDVVYEPGKCILCDACVRIAAEAGEELGVALIGRGFDVSMAVPFGEPLSQGLRQVAERCALACPTGALALRTARSCDLPGCGGCSLVQLG